MGIRLKLLILLLLLISLIPLLAVGVGIKRDLARLGEELAARSSAVLIRKAHSGLQRIVEDHARILKREKQLLESSALFMASRVEGIIYGHEHAAAEQDFTTTADEIRTAGEAYYFLHMHGRQNLDVDFDALETRPGSAAPPGLDEAAVHGMLLPLMKRMKFQYPELMLWVDMTLADRTRITYPKSASDRFMREPLYEASPSRLPDRVVWSRPQTDARTRLLVFNVTAPIKDPEGKIRGEIPSWSPSTSCSTRACASTSIPTTPSRWSSSPRTDRRPSAAGSRSSPRSRTGSPCAITGGCPRGTLGSHPAMPNGTP